MRPVAPLLALALLAPGVGAQQRAKMTAMAADLTPAFEYLTQRGIHNQAGLKDAYGRIEAMYRPIPAEAAAQLVPWGFNNIHVPFSMRGEPVPDHLRRPGLQIAASYIELGESPGERMVNAGVVVHEIAHGEFNYWKYRSKSGRLQRQHDLMYRLEKDLQDNQGFRRTQWTLFRANEMAAYYIETSVHEIKERIETIFLVNRFGVRRIKSRAEREALIGPDGREILLADPTNPSIKPIYEKPPWLVGGTKGDAWFDGEPIEAEIPEAMRLDFYRNVLGLQLPETGEEVVAIARSLQGEWADHQRALLKQARDRQVERLEDPTPQGAPSTADLTVQDGASGPDVPTEEESSLLARVANGVGRLVPPYSVLRHRGSQPDPDQR